MVARGTSSFAQQLKQYRRRHGLTQEQLGERAGLSARGIRALEGQARKPYRDTIRRLADALALTLDERVTFEGAARVGMAASPPHSPQPIGGFLGATPEGEIIGRKHELEQILPILSTVQSGAGQVVMLAGEPGIGKTRLAQEVGSAAQMRGFLVASGHCYESEQLTPYYPFLDTLVMVHAQTTASIRAQVPARWPQLERLLPDRSLPMQEEEMGGPEAQQRLFWAVSGFLKAVAERTPLALLLDDLHWADASSLRLLQHLARQTHCCRVLLVGTYRGREVETHLPLERAIRHLTREGLLKDVALGPLDQESTGALAASLLGAVNDSDELTELLYRHTDGNPFFTVQVMGALVERGDVFLRDGSWDRRAVEEAGVPRSIRSAIRERLSRLGTTTQEVLEEASILGQAFRFSDLHAMGERPEAKVERALDKAMTVGLVQEIDSESYAFDHSLTQQSLYSELGNRRRRRLHLAAAGVIEQLPAPTRDGRAAELAWHFLQGDDAQRALLWSLQAGDAAESVFAHSEAESHYRTAVQLARKQQEKTRLAETLVKQAATLAFLGHHDEQIDLLEEAAGLLHELGDQDGAMLVTAQLGWAHGDRGTRDEGIARLQAAVDDAKCHGVAQAAIRIALANLLEGHGQFEQALGHIERGITLAREAGDRPLLGRAEGRRGLILWQEGRADEAVQAYTVAVSMAEETGDVDTLSRSLNNLGDAYLAQADLRRARHAFDRSLDVARRAGDLGHLVPPLMNRGDLSFFAGKWDTVEEYWHEAADIARLLGSSQMRRTLPFVPGLRMLRDADESAVHELEELASRRASTGDAVVSAWSRLWLADYDLVQDHPERVPPRLERVLTGPAVEAQERAMFVLLLGEAYARLGRLDEAQQLVDEYLQSRTLGGLRSHLPWHTVLGIVRTRQERWDEARAAFDTVLGVGEMLYFRGRALYYVGDMHLHRGEIGHAVLAWHEARDLFRRFPARLLVAWVERALAKL